MTTLNDVLNDEAQRAAIVADCCQLIDGEVAKKKGIGGMAVKTGYKLVQGIKPGFVRSVVEKLLPEFADALEPLRSEAATKGQSLSQFFHANSGQVADALLAVTDARAENADGPIKGAYGKLRGSAKKNVESAVPGLGQIVERYLTS